MARQVKLNELDDVLESLEYPITPDAAATECSDVTLELADGEYQLADVLTDSNENVFDSAEELENDVYGLLPRKAVGEPYQSEGEG